MQRRLRVAAALKALIPNASAQEIADALSVSPSALQACKQLLRQVKPELPPDASELPVDGDISGTPSEMPSGHEAPPARAISYAEVHAMIDLANELCRLIHWAPVPLPPNRQERAARIQVAERRGTSQNRANKECEPFRHQTLKPCAMKMEELQKLPRGLTLKAIAERLGVSYTPARTIWFTLPITSSAVPRRPVRSREPGGGKWSGPNRSGNRQRHWASPSHW